MVGHSQSPGQFRGCCGKGVAVGKSGDLCVCVHACMYACIRTDGCAGEVEGGRTRVQLEIHLIHIHIYIYIYFFFVSHLSLCLYLSMYLSIYLSIYLYLSLYLLETHKESEKRAMTTVPFNGDTTGLRAIPWEGQAVRSFRGQQSWMPGCEVGLRGLGFRV